MKKTSNTNQLNIVLNILFIIIVLAGLFFLTQYSFNLIAIRDRDNTRVSDLGELNNALAQNYKLSSKYPMGQYSDLKKSLSMLIKVLPQDPFDNDQYKYHYYSNGKSYVLLAKMEASNLYAQTDHGKYNKKPLYYEIGSGPNWQSLIPNNLK